jgi:hypothetical protein
MAMSPRLLRPRATGFNPKNISGLAAWFDADDASTFTLSGSAVSEWRDKSGNGYSVSQSTGNNQPARTGTIGGRACIDFDGTNDYLVSDGTGLGAAMSGDKATTTFIVGEMHNAAEWAINSQGTWLSWGSSASGNQFIYFRTPTANSGPGINTRNDASVAQNNPNHDLPSGDGAGAGTAIDSFIYSASISTIASASPSVSRVHTAMNGLGDTRTSAVPVNGSISVATAGRSGAFTLDRFTVGALGRTTFSDNFPARIAEVIIYSRVLSDAERARVVQWLGAKYALAVFDQAIPAVANADAQAWINNVYANGGTVSTATANAVNTFCTSIESAGIRDRFYRLNLFAGTGLSAALVPLYRGTSLGGTQYGNTTDTNNNFVSGDYVETGASGGLLGNGTSKYLNTGLLPTAWPSISSFHVSAFAFGVTQAGPSQSSPIGIRNNTAPANRWGFDYRQTSTQFHSGGNLADSPAMPSVATDQHWVATRASVTSASGFINGVSQYTNATDVTATLTARANPFFVFAQNTDTVAGAFSPLRLGGYSLGASLSAAQGLAFYNTMQAFQTSLTRNV